MANGGASCARVADPWSTVTLREFNSMIYNILGDCEPAAYGAAYCHEVANR
jgi:hypothetical protein